MAVWILSLFWPMTVVKNGIVHQKRPVNRLIGCTFSLASTSSVCDVFLLLFDGKLNISSLTYIITFANF